MTAVRLGATKVLTPQGLVDGDVVVRDGTITELVGPTPGGAGVVCPGFVDLQVNGFAGYDFLSGEGSGLRSAAQAIAATGVTGYLATLVTAPLGVLVQRRRELTVEATDLDGARLLGFHLEGPFISEHQLGTHVARHRCDPDVEVGLGLIADSDGGPVRLVTLAPELDGAGDLIAELVRRGVVVAAGHSDATAAQARAAFDRGLSVTTHHGNAMRRFHQREPGLFAAGLVDQRVAVTVIADGVHVADDTIRLIATAAGDRLVLVTDAVAIAGLDAAHAKLGAEIELRRVDGAVRNQRGDLAGSALTMDTAVRNLVDLGIDAERALTAASIAPRRAVGLAHDLTTGEMPADLVHLDDDLTVQTVVIDGHTAHET